MIDADHCERAAIKGRVEEGRLTTAIEEQGHIGCLFLHLKITDMMNENYSGSPLATTDENAVLFATGIGGEQQLVPQTGHCKNDNSEEIKIATENQVESETTPAKASLIPNIDSAALKFAGYSQQPAIGYTRAEFLFARVKKPTADSAVGISFSPRLHRPNKRGKATVADGTVISRIEPDSLFAGTNLRVGDHVVSINKVPCLKAKPEKIARLVKLAKRAVAIVVHDPTGDPSVVSSCVYKPPSAERVGVTIKNVRGSLRITKVAEMGLFHNSLLNPGHRCIMINEINCHTMPSHEAAKLLVRSTGMVTIVSRPRDELAVVVACETYKGVWSDWALVFSLSAGAPSAVHIFS